MNTISKLITAGVLSLGLFIIQSCVQDDDYSVPSLDCPQKVKTTTTISELLQLVKTNTLKVDEKGLVAEDLIIEGIVNISDESGNISNTISIQDKATDATAGIQIELAERPLYGFYPIGSTVQVHLKNLKVGLDRGTIRIGTKIEGVGATQYSLDRIPKELRQKVLVKTCDKIEKIVPKEFISIEEALKEENVNTLVTIKNIQFKSPETAITYYPSGSTASADNVRLIDSKGKEADLRISKFANFKDAKLPTNSGEITVLVSKFNSNYQLYIRDTNDVNFNQPRFGEGASACSELSSPNITLTELVAKVNQGSISLDANKAIADNLFVHAYVISSDETGNFFKTISLQDKTSLPTAGIQIELDQTNLYKDYPLGSKVQVNLKGLVVAVDRGAMKIGSVDKTYAVGRIPSSDIKKYLIKSCDPVQTIQPRVVENLEEAVKPAYVNTLITVKKAQFKNATADKTYGVANTTVSRVLEDVLGNTLDLRNSGYSKWYAEALPTGSGSITLVVSPFNTSYQAFIRDTQDVNFNQPRFEGVKEDVVEINGSLENFEAGRKTTFAAGDLTLSTGVWLFNDAGVFAETEANDIKNSGTGAARLRGSSTTEGFIQTKFYIAGLKTIKLYLAGTTFNEGDDADKEIKLEALISTDNGSTWKSVGEKTSERGKMNLVEFSVNASANAKVMVKLVNKSFLRSTKNRLRINVDDIEFIK